MFPGPCPQLDNHGNDKYNTPMITAKRSTRIEITGRELAILEAALFDGMVRLLQDGKAFDIENPDDDQFMMECRAEADTIKGLNRKLDFARKMMEAEP